MCVAAPSQGAVFGPAGGIVLDGHSAPVLEGVDQAGLADAAADDALCLSESSGDRCDGAQAAQGLVVPGLQGSGRLREW